MKMFFEQLILFCLILGIGSCGQKKESDLEIKISANQAIVLEYDAYSCLQLLTGIRGTDGTYVTPEIKGPVVTFNNMSFKWKKTSKLYISQAKIKFKGSGIRGGETSCDLTKDLYYLFEADSTVNSPALYSNGTFFSAGTITTNPKCRITCSMPLANPNVPEIAATGELVVKATEVNNEGTTDEKYFRVRSNYQVRVTP